MRAVKLPPGPKGNFLIGSLVEFSRDPLAFIDRCARDYGDVVSVGIANLSVYQIYNPEDIEYVLVTNHRNFIKDRVARQKLFRLLLGNGLLTSDGDFWIRQRRLAQPAFHRDRIAGYGEVMVAYTERMLDGWRERETRDVHQEMMRLTLQIVAKTLFDTDVAGEAEEVGRTLEVTMDRFSSQGSMLRMLDNYLPTPGRRRFEKAVEKLDKIIYDIISRRRESGKDAGNLLSMLLAAQDEDGSRMNDRQLRDEAMTLFLAGHETTALALSWTWYLLANNKEVAEKLFDEIQAVLGDRKAEMSDLPRLSYTEMVVKESLRLYPPAWGFGRQAVDDCEIGGYFVPAGTQVFINPWTTHRDSRFFEDPLAFRPERWAGDLEKQLPRFAYMPFGGGPRLCIGNAFARMEAALILATIAQRFRFTLVPGQKITPWPAATLRPKEGIRANIVGH